MKTPVIAQVEVISFLVLLFIRLPPSPQQRSLCPRDKAAIVRKVVAKRWIPILERVGAAMPLECPLHPTRDIFGIQESKKKYLAPQWSCGFCGKAFYHEENLDSHFDNRHPDQLNDKEDSVCLADFCDVMRCEVLQEKLRELDQSTGPVTAVDLWHQPRLVTTLRSPFTQELAVERAVSRSLMRTSSNLGPWKKSSQLPSEHSPETTKDPATHSVSSRPRRNKISSPEKSKAADDSSWDRKCLNKDKDACHDDFNFSEYEGSLPSGGPRELPVHPLHSWKDTCNEEHFAELRVKCQQLIHQCVAGLVLNLTLEQVRDVEAAFHRAICWYLTCERYWEAGAMEPPDLPWGLVTTLALLLTLGVSLCYYVVWVLCESQDSGSPAISPAVEEISKRCAVPNSTSQRPAPPPSTKTVTVSRSYSQTVPSTSTAKARFNTQIESENECRDSGFNEGSLYPESQDAIHTSGYNDYDSQSYRSRHYSEDSRLSLPPEDSSSRYYLHEERVYNYASTFTPNYEQRRLRRNRYNYLDDFDSCSEFEADVMDENCSSRERSDSFIYVSYPVDVKKRFTETR